MHALQRCNAAIPDCFRNARYEKVWVGVIINVMPWNITVDFLVDGDDLVGLGLGADTGEPQFEVHWED